MQSLAQKLTVTDFPAEQLCEISQHGLAVPTPHRLNLAPHTPYRQTATHKTSSTNSSGVRLKQVQRGVSTRVYGLAFASRSFMTHS